MGSRTAILCGLFSFSLFVLKIGAGLLLNKTSAVPVYFRFYLIVRSRKRVGNLFELKELCCVNPWTPQQEHHRKSRY